MCLEIKMLQVNNFEFIIIFFCFYFDVRKRAILIAYKFKLLINIRSLFFSEMSF